MPRVKRGTQHVKHRRNILKAAKGFKWGRKSKIKLAKTAVTKAGAHAFRDRRVKKRTRRALWQVKINAAAHANGTSYSQLISALTKMKAGVDRKILAEIAAKHPETFASLVSQVKSKK